MRHERTCPAGPRRGCQRCVLSTDQTLAAADPADKGQGQQPRDGLGDRPSVELDAIPPGELRALVQRCIEQHIDRDQLDHLRVVENEERQLLRIFVQQVAGEGAP